MSEDKKFNEDEILNNSEQGIKDEQQPVKNNDEIKEKKDDKTIESVELISGGKKDTRIPEDYSKNKISIEDNYNRFVSKEESMKSDKSFRWNIAEEQTHREVKKARRKKGLGIRIFAALMTLMFVITSISTVSLLMENQNKSPVSSELPIITNSQASKSTDNQVTDTSIIIPKSSNGAVLTTQQVIEKVKPSVVCIEVSVEVKNSFFNKSYTESGVGTGFIISADGYIATNFHVIDGAQEIKVTLTSGKTYDATVIGGDEIADLAVLKIDAGNLPVVILGDSDILVQGDDVVAIGTPAGIEFAGTTTKGIISAINRNVDVGSEYAYSSRKMTVLQTDASINPGNSGGPLVNNKGEVIGINTMKLASSLYEGMGFAIPINTAIPTINDLIQNPGIKRADIGSGEAEAEDKSSVSFGITGGTVSEEESQYKGIPQGFKISDITKGGAADGSGIVVGDIIVALDGKTVTSYNDLLALKMNYKPGDKAVVTVYRNGDNYDFTITLAARQQS